MYRKHADIMLRQVGDDYLAYNPYTNETLVVTELTFTLLKKLSEQLISLEYLVEYVKDNYKDKFYEINISEFKESLKLLAARGVIECIENPNDSKS